MNILSHIIHNFLSSDSCLSFAISLPAYVFEEHVWLGAVCEVQREHEPVRREERPGDVAEDQLREHFLQLAEALLRIAATQVLQGGEGP